MAHITLTQLRTVLGRIVTWATSKFAARNATSGKLEYADMPVVVLASMGAELDGAQISLSPGSTYFLPAGGGVGARIMFMDSQGVPAKISDPVSSVIYCNAYTGLLYRWDTTTSQMEPVGGEGDGLRKVYVDSHDYSSLDALHTTETSGVYQVIDQTLQRTVGILVVSCDNQHGLIPHFVTQWLFSNLTLQGNDSEFVGTIDGTHYTIGKAHIIHRFYNASTPVSGNNDIPLNAWSDWKAYGLTFDEMTELVNGLISTKQDTLVAGNGITIAQDGKTVSVAEAIRTGAAAGSTAVQSVSVNNNPVTPDGNGNVNIEVTGIKGDKGDKGDTVVLDPSQVEQFDIINSLNAQVAGNALDAYQGAKLKAQIDYVYARLQAVYAALGNIAFWDGKPAAATILPNLDWGLPKHTLTLNLTLSNASVKVNGTAHANGDTISVEEYAPLSVLIEPSADHLFNTAPTLTFGGQSVTLTPNQDGSYSADVVMGQSDATIAVVATGVASYSISYGTMTNCSVVTSPAPTSILGGTGVVEIEFSVDSGYELSSSCFSQTNATLTYNASTNKLTISNATGNVTISATAAVRKVKFLRGYRYTSPTTLSNSSWTVNGVEHKDDIAASEMMHIPAPASAVSAIPTVNAYWGVSVQTTDSKPVAVALFEINEGVFTMLCVYYFKAGSKSKGGVTSWEYGDGKTSADVVAAYNAGKLGIRTSIYIENNKLTHTTVSPFYGVQFGSFVFAPIDNYEFITDATNFIQRVFDF